MRQPKQPKHPAKGSTAHHHPKRGTGKSVSPSPHSSHVVLPSKGGPHPHGGGKGKGGGGKGAGGGISAGPHHGVHLPVQPHHAKAPAKKPAKRGLTPGDVPCCAAQALGASLRLAGHPVGPEAVLALHAAAGGSRDAGVTIQAVLEAASAFGLGGHRLSGFGPVCPGDPGAVILGVELPGAHTVTLAGDGCWVSWGEHYDPAGWPDAVIEEAWTVQWAA